METQDEFKEAPTPSSFTLKQTAKGRYYWDIKIYDNDLEVMQAKIKSMDDWARKEYGEDHDALD